MNTLTKATKNGFKAMNLGVFSTAIILCNFTDFLGVLGLIGLAFTAIVLIVKLFD